MVAATKKGPATKKMKLSANNSVDVTKTPDITKLADILKKNKFVVVLIWADYCGHCHTYKDQVWNKLLNNKKRRAGLASIHYDQLETTPSAIPKKVSGYPTVLFIGKNGVPMKFKDDTTGASTSEYSKSRDLATMNNIVESEDPESLINGVNSDSLNGETPPLTEEAESASASVDPDDVLSSISEPNNNVTPKSKVITPNPMNDMLNSQNSNKPLSVETKKMDSGRVLATSGGGSLFKALVDIFKKKQTRSVKSKRGRQTRRAIR